MAPKLTEGSLSVIMNGGQYENAVLQVLGSKKIVSATPGDKERYRLLLSDGKNLISSAMLSTQMITKISGTGEIPMFTVIKLNKHITSVINNAGNKNKRILILLDIDLVESGDSVGKKIGEPVQLGEGESSQANTNGHSSTNNAPAPKPTPPVNHADVSMNGISQNMITNPIISLSPYNGKWTIKARVMNKSPIKTWSNSRGEGKLFSMDVVDSTGEIRITAFRDIVDKFYDMIEVDKIYYISRGQIKLANKQFSTLKNDYEITLGNESSIQECVEEGDDNIPLAQYDFVTIDQLANKDVGTVLDIIGVCKSATELQTFTSKSSGKELKKVEVTLVDASNFTVALTLWGSEAESFNGSTNPVVLVKGAKLGEFGGGKNISTGFGCTLKINPNLPEAHKLRGWFDNGGSSSEGVNLSARTATGGSSNWLTIKEAQEKMIGRNDKAEYYQTKGMITLMRSENIVYKACSVCNKKAVDLENGMIRCEKCNREYPTFKYRLLAHANICDFSGSQWATIFNDDVEKILGITAEEVGNRLDDLQSVANLALFQSYVFRFRAKLESYNDETRLQQTVVRVEKVPNKEHNMFMINRIQQLSGVTL